MADGSLSDSNNTIGFDPASMEYLSQDSGDSNLSNLPAPIIPRGQGHGGGRFTTRDRPFACHVCNKRFTQKAHLIIHKRIHTGEKPYACHICHKRFAQSSHLTVHKRVHTGEKPFFCNFCGMGFCRRPRLEAHVLQHVVKEGRQLPNDFRGDMLSNLSMVSLSSSSAASQSEVTNQESLDAAAQLMEMKMKGEVIPEIKAEPLDIDESNDVVNDVITDVHANDKDNEVDVIRKRRKPEFVRRLENKDGLEDGGIEDVDSKNINDNSTGKNNFGDSNSGVLSLSPDELDKFTSSLTELSDVQRQALNHSLMMGSGKKQLNNLVNHNNNNSFMSNNSSNNSNRMHSTSMMMSPGLTMSGLVRTNSRISLVDYTAEDILQHLMTRDDVKSCDFCCIVFHDPAMYYLHRSMHDKMDVRCCNLCGKLLTDKYDFTAHFLSQHK